MAARYRVIASDLDDTLADTKQPITQNVSSLITELLNDYEFCVITGGKFDQIKRNVIDQLPASSKKHWHHLHAISTSGACYHRYDPIKDQWQELYNHRMDVDERTRIAEVIEQVVRQEGLWEDQAEGEIIHDRESQVTFSALGQNASPEVKRAWDPTRHKRQQLRLDIAASLPKYEVVINGTTSIDVLQNGIDKSFGIQMLMREGGYSKQEIIFFGDSLEPGGNDYPVKQIGVHSIAVDGWQETAKHLSQLLASHPNVPVQYIDMTERPIINDPEQIVPRNPEGIAVDIADLRTRFITLNPSSREDMKTQLTEMLDDPNTRIIDTHNTKSMIFIFTALGEEFGLKIEYGDAKVTRDEAHWYEKAPDRLKKHFVYSEMEDEHAFVLLRWFEGAPTIEQLAQSDAPVGELPAIDAYLDALAQDEELFGSFDSIELEYGNDHSFFRDKFYTKLKQAEPYPYLTDLLTSKSVTINSETYPGPTAFIDYVHHNPELLAYLTPARAGFIHGDLHADNLIVDSGNVYVVDPNGLDHLPLEYDHGRVMWSLSGWNAIVNHEHRLEKHEDGSYTLKVPVRAQYEQGMDRIKQYFMEFSARNGLEPEQAYHRALYSSAMQYLSRADHAAVEHEATALHLRGIQQFSDLFQMLDITLELQ